MNEWGGGSAAIFSELLLEMGQLGFNCRFVQLAIGLGLEKFRFEVEFRPGASGGLDVAPGPLLGLSSLGSARLGCAELRSHLLHLVLGKLQFILLHRDLAFEQFHPPGVLADIDLGQLCGVFVAYIAREPAPALSVITSLSLDLQLAPAALQLVAHAGHRRPRLNHGLTQPRGDRPWVGPRMLRQQPVEPGSQAV